MQVSSKLRRYETGYTWRCPACQEMHSLPDSWTFDGNLEAPTFSPSFKHTGIQIEKDEAGDWTGRWLTESGEAKDFFGSEDKPRPWCCHYVITAGQVAYCNDCTHTMAGQTVPMPELPETYRDPKE
jgi:hypothetical protein